MMFHYVKSHHLNVYTFHELLPPQGFRPEAKSKGGTPVTRAYIKESTYTWNIQSVYQKKSRCAWTGAARNQQVMTTFLLFTPASMKWLRWRKDRKFRWNRLGSFCDSFCTVILRYSFALRVISDILWSSGFESYGSKDTCSAKMKL